MADLQTFFQSLHGWAGYGFLFISSLGENLFPPMPGDTFVVLGAFLVGRGQLQFFPAYMSATAGSISGFMILYGVGRRWGRTFLEGRRGRFLPSDQLIKVDAWFDRYGMGVIAINRFLAGFRALVSFGAGIARMPVWRVFSLCVVSCLAWNAILMGLGVWAGAHWRTIISHYQWIVSVTIMILILWWVFKIQKRKNKKVTTE